VPVLCLIEGCFQLQACSPPENCLYFNENNDLRTRNGGQLMTKSELIERIAEQQDQLSVRDVELAVKLMLDHMSTMLSSGERIEIRGFGSFSLHYRAPRVGRNPKTGDSVELAGKYVPHFKPGKEMRDRVNDGL